MAKNAGMPVDTPSMVEPGKITHSEADFFGGGKPSYDPAGFDGAEEIGRQKGNRNDARAFPPQVDGVRPFKTLRRR